MSSKKFKPEDVYKDNSNIRQYSDQLWRVLRKERFNKSFAILNVAYDLGDSTLEGDLGLLTDYYGKSTTNPFLAIDLKIDFDKFRETLIEKDQTIFDCLLAECYTHPDIGELLGIGKKAVGKRVRNIKKLFIKFYSKD